MFVLESGDKLRGDASSALVIDYTVHGLVGTVLTQLADGQFPAIIGDIYTSGAIVVVSSITIVNTDAVARTLNLYLTPSGGTARRLIPKDLTLGAGYALLFDGAKFSVMDSSGLIQVTGGGTLANSAVTTPKINTSAVTTSKIAALNITTTLIASSAVTTPKIKPLNVTTTLIAASAVTTPKIKALNITTTLIAASAVTTPKIKPLNVTTTLIAASAVTTPKINTSAVTTSKIAALNITTTLIASSAVTTPKIKPLNVTTTLIAASAVTTPKIKALNITTTLIAASAVTTPKIKPLNVTTTLIAASAVTTAKINTSAVTTPKIKALNITTTLIAASAVTTPKIKPLNVTTTLIAASAVTTAKINNKNITYVKIQDVSATDKLLGRSSAGSGVVEEIACTAAGRALIDDAAAINQRVTLGVTDANDRMPTAMLPTKLIHSYWHASWDERTAVAGTWGQIVSASRTDYDDSLLSTAGFIQNTTHANNDEIHFGSLTLNAGTYKVVISYVKSNDCAIFEALHGTTSLGTQDAYAAADANAVLTLTYSPTTRVTGNLRLKASGKNGASSAYNVDITRVEIIRTA